MDLYALLVWIIVGGVAGWLAGLIVKGFGFGLIGNIVLGIVGAVVAGWLSQARHFARRRLVGSIISAAIGAIIILLMVRLIKRA